MKLLSNGHFASPQAGSALCAIAVYEVALEEAELTASAVYDLGPLPEKGNPEKLWRFSHVTTAAYEGIDGGTGVRLDLGVESDVYRFAFANAAKLLNGDIEFNARNHGAAFTDDNLQLLIRTAPSTPQDGKLRVILWGWAG